ncbi:MAG: aminoglycoside phosphotransferase family protein [Planctomycetales bacterium]|nr:aminoglycoside phosphotransferase family protein [Planctomycetales bacterium]MBN8627036.1 aminoglycoside phosphotransferase family protein [Planctomycetota bacterium]
MDAASLDIENRADCQRYLVAAGHCRAGEVTEHKVLAGGVSSRTVLVAFTDGRRWVLKQSLAKLRVAADWFSDPRRIHREALGMRVLGELLSMTYPGRIPRLMFDDETNHVLGMEAVPEPHENWKTMLMDGRVHHEYFSEFGRILGTIHGASYILGDQYAPLFADRTFFETLRIEPYYKYSSIQAPVAGTFLFDLIEETRGNALCLVHGDFSPKNILVHNKHLVLLDHEVIHWGDPAFDVGFAMSHLLVKTRFSGYTAHALENNFPDDYFLSDELWENPTLSSDEYRRRCLRHTLACLLARAVGRSPLEYLNAAARMQQCNVTLSLIKDLPADFPELLTRFTRAMGTEF